VKQSAEQVTSDYFDSIVHDPIKLNDFLNAMPKGGELHHHALGSNFAETLIDISVEADCFINPRTLELYRNKEKAFSQVVPDHEAMHILEFIDQNPDNRDRIIDAWSVRNYKSHGHDGHDWFFASFSKFKEAFFVNTPRCLNSILKTAENENIQYVETMIGVPEVNEKALQLVHDLSDYDSSSDGEQLLTWFNELTEMGMQQLVSDNIDSLNSYYDRSHVETPVTMKFMAYGLRIYPLLQQTFAEMMLNFSTADQSDLVVGVNFVAPEDNPIALEQYREHMKLFQFMHRKYPEVKISLHAGEITDRLRGIDSLDLCNHIWEAISIGNANRIGHGVDIRGEQNSAAILDHMAVQFIAIEINLRSNEVILQTDSANHPINNYLEAGVPVCLSTDDAGILRTTLADQYALALKYSPTLKYSDVKQLVKNTITYSFLSDDEKEHQLGVLQQNFLTFEDSFRH
jgi:adenosine deaminase